MTKSVLSTITMLFVAATVEAQTTTQLPIQFDFLNPGARSLALGSAFSGLADDASAAFTNPAGLLKLTRPEISFEGRFRRLDTRFLSAGRISGTVLNMGEDRIAGPVYDEDRDSSFGPSFISFTYPAGRFVVAGYRHELSRIDTGLLYRGVFERATFAGVTDDRNRDIPLTGERRIQIDNYGGSVGFKVNDKLNIGAGINVLTFDLDSSFRRVGLPDLFGAPDLSVTGSTAVQTGDDVAAGFSVGLQAILSPQFSLGAVYRKAPAFEFRQVDTIPFRPTLDRTGDFQVPNTFSLGIAYKPTIALTVVADYVRVGYGALKDDYIAFQAVQLGTADQLSLEDGNEFHAGVEYVFTKSRLVPALRGGFWFDPDHVVTYVPTGRGDQLDQRFQFILPGGDDLWHYTFGGGLSLSPMFEVNGGADISKRSSQASVSIIIRFP